MERTRQAVSFPFPGVPCPCMCGMGGVYKNCTTKDFDGIFDGIHEIKNNVIILKQHDI